MATAGQANDVRFQDALNSWFHSLVCFHGLNAQCVIYVVIVTPSCDEEGNHSQVATLGISQPTLWGSFSEKLISSLDLFCLKPPSVSHENRAQALRIANRLRFDRLSRLDGAEMMFFFGKLNGFMVSMDIYGTSIFDQIHWNHWNPSCSKDVSLKRLWLRSIQAEGLWRTDCKKMEVSINHGISFSLHFPFNFQKRPSLNAQVLPLALSTQLCDILSGWCLCVGCLV